MRSRFSAYAQRNIAYLAETWDSSTRPADIDLSKEDVTWIRLEIASLKKGAKSDKKGIVEFRAFYDHNGEQHVMREISRFRKVENQWYYLDGTVKSIGKVGAQTNLGRNAPCPCGSGKKAKRCCG
jgi:SEC-C motif-containing protein